MEYISNIIANQSSPPAGCTKEHSFSSHNHLSTGCRHQLDTSPGMGQVAPVVPDGGASPDSDGEVSPDSDGKVERLLKAAEEGRLEEVEELLQSNANIDATEGKFQRTPLHFAARSGHRDIVDLLLEKNAQIEAKDRDQITPLHLAARSGHRDIVDLLLEKNAQIEAKDRDQITPLHFAARSGHRDIVDLLLEKNAQIEANTEIQGTPLHFAAGCGHRDIADLLLDQILPDGFVSDLDQRLLKAAEEGRQEEVKELLQSNANIDATEGKFQRTPLHLAARSGHRDIVGLLLDEKADIEAKNGHQQTPLHYAAAYFDHNEEVVTLLLEKGAGLGAQDCNGKSALSVILDGSHRSLGLEALGRLLAEKNLWSRSVLVAIIKLNNQDSILHFLKSWPQNAWTGVEKPELKRARVPERLRTVLAYPWRGEAGELDESDAEFSAQNLFWAQEVPVTLEHLPGVWGSDAVNEDFLELLADCPHDGIFETDAVQAMALAAWQQYRAFTLLEIFSACLTVICLCWASYGFRHGFALSTPPFYVVAALHLKKSLDESNQVLPHLVQCLKCSANLGSYMTFDNAADALYLVGGWFAIARQLSIGSDELEKPWMAVFAAAAWLRLLYSLRAEMWMGPRLLPILSAVKDTFAFFLLMVICIASAAHAYYNLQLREEPTPTYAALMQVVRLGVFGDFDIFEFEGLDPTYRLKDDSNNEWEPIDPSPGPDYFSVHILFYMTGVGITVLLMNVLIGVLSSNYERYKAQSVGQFFRTRVKMLVELQGRPLERIVRHLFNYRREGPYRWLFVCLRGFCRIVLSILLIACFPCLLIIFLVCLLFFRRGGMMYTIYCSLGWFGFRKLPASDCRIFLVVRAALKTPLEEIQIQQHFLEEHHQDLESKIEKMEFKLERHHEDLEAKLERHHQDLESKISQIHDLLLEATQTGRRNSAEEPEGLDTLESKIETKLDNMEKHHQDLETKLERHHQDLASKIETKLERHHEDLESKIAKVEHKVSQIHELLLGATSTGQRNCETSPQAEMDRQKLLLELPFLE